MSDRMDPATLHAHHVFETEADFQASVIKEAEARGWWTHHHLRSKGSSAGWPDLVLLRGTEALFVELKLEKGQLSAAQMAVLARLKHARLRAFVWRPSDWREIEEVLA